MSAGLSRNRTIFLRSETSGQRVRLTVQRGGKLAESEILDQGAAAPFMDMSTVTFDAAIAQKGLVTPGDRRRELGGGSQMEPAARIELATY